MKNMEKKAFTLAEVMIVLSVIGILTSILLPAAWNATPDEDLIKFKKAHNTFTMAIRELVTSDKYYLNGSLCEPLTYDLIPDSTYNNDDITESKKYFCKTFSEIINFKSAECGTTTKTGTTNVILNATAGVAPTETEIETAKSLIDTECKKSNTSIVTLENGVQIFESSDAGFFTQKLTDHVTSPEDNPIDADTCTYKDQYSADSTITEGYDNLRFGTNYKIFCIDVDGIPDTATADDCVNECPFGYGVRADGKIFTGARADEWLAKSLQGED